MQSPGLPGAPPNLEVSHLFRRGWEIFKRKPGLIIGAGLVAGILTSLDMFVVEGSASELPLSVVSLLLLAPLTVGFDWLTLKVVRGESVQFSTLFSGFQQLGRSTGVVWLGGSLVGIGLVLLVVPGLILSAGLLPAGFLVMDSEFGVTDCLRRAWKMTDGRKGQLLLLELALLGLNLLGLLVLLVGVLVTSALSIVILAVAYDELSGSGGAETDPSATWNRPPPIS